MEYNVYLCTECILEGKSKEEAVFGCERMFDSTFCHYCNTGRKDKCIRPKSMQEETAIKCLCFTHAKPSKGGGNA